LHELIHVCQRANDLEKLNKKYLIDGINLLKTIISEYPKIKDDFFNYVFKQKISHISMISSWIFEIWDELYLKNNYGEFEEKKHETTYARISKDAKDDVYDNFGSWRKYPLFGQLIRATYLQKITNGKDISKKYLDLSEKWKKILKDSTSDEEYCRLMKILEDLTNVDDFNNVGLKKLETAYDLIINEMISEVKKDYE